MKVTQVVINEINIPESPKLKAEVRVCIDDELQLTGLRIYHGSNGLFVSYPNDPRYKGEDYKQIFYPVSKVLRYHIEGVVIEQYRRDFGVMEIKSILEELLSKIGVEMDTINLDPLIDYCQLDISGEVSTDKVSSAFSKWLSNQLWFSE
jgi:DNA-binding cell septation regulator SpoVG